MIVIVKRVCSNTYKDEYYWTNCHLVHWIKIDPSPLLCSMQRQSLSGIKKRQRSLKHQAATEVAEKSGSDRVAEAPCSYKVAEALYSDIYAEASSSDRGRCSIRQRQSRWGIKQRQGRWNDSFLICRNSHLEVTPTDQAQRTNVAMAWLRWPCAKLHLEGQKPLTTRHIQAQKTHKKPT